MHQVRLLTSVLLHFLVIIFTLQIGNVYIADSSNQRIRKVTVSTGIISTVAGSGGTGSCSGDNGPATTATLNYSYGVALDSSGISSYHLCAINHETHFHSLLGNIYIADNGNHRIRKVTVSTGVISTIAGSSTSGGYGGDNGAATSATLNSAQGVTLDSSGNSFYIRVFRGTHSPLSTRERVHR